jgi:hypothetical protein
MARDKRTAAQCYTDHRADIAVLVDCIQTELADHAKRAAKKPKDWGFAGDLDLVRDALKDVFELLLVGQHGWSETEASRFIEDFLEDRRAQAATRQPTTRVRGRHYPTMREALKNQGHDESAVACDQGYLVVTKNEAERLTAAGKEFAYICDHKGTLVTVPVNDRPERSE